MALRGPRRAAAALAGLLLAGALAPGAGAPATDAVVKYYDAGAANTPRFRYWNSTALGAEKDMLGLGGAALHNGTIAAGSTRHEFLFAGVTGASEVRAQVWRHPAAVWADSITLTTTAPGASYPAVAAAYQNTSGDALVVYSDNTATPKFRVWDGAWGAEQSVAVATTGAIQHVRMAAQRGSDRVALVTGDANSHVHATVWDGAAWGSALTLTTSGGSPLLGPFDLAWEGSSGDLMVVYDTGTNLPKYRTWTSAGGWSAEGSLPSNGGAAQLTRWVRLAARTGSDTIFSAIQDSGDDLQTCEWTGTAWCGSSTRQVNGIGAPGARNYDLAVEASSGDALLVYGRSGNGRLQYRAYTTSWSGAASTPDINTSNADVPQWVAAFPDPRSNNVFTLFTDGGSRLGFQRWDGGAWQNTTEPEWNSDKGSLGLAAAFRATAPGLPWVDTDGTYNFGAGAFGDRDATQAPGRIEASDGVPGRVYNRTGAAATGNWGQWAAIPGVLNVGSGTGAEQAGRYIKAKNIGVASAAETFTFEACGEDGEADVSHVRVESDHAPLDDHADGADGNGHAVTAGERAATTKPTSGPGIDQDGYAVWNPTSSGGDCVAVQYRYTWDQVPSGTYKQRASARNAGGAWAMSPPAHADTTAFDTSATATLDFSAAWFAGALDPAFRVALDNRVDFAWHVGTQTDPSQVAVWTGASADDADGAVAIPVNTLHDIVWVSYTLDVVNPSGVAVLLDQAYTASFTWG